MGTAIVNDVTGFTDPKMVEFVANSNCGVVVMHAGELTEPVRAPHTAVTLDTSAAAYAAEREAERARAEAEGKPQPRVAWAERAGGKVLGEPRLKGGAIQQRLPFGDVPNGSAAAEAEQNKAAETDASVDAAPGRRAGCRGHACDRGRRCRRPRSWRRPFPPRRSPERLSLARTPSPPPTSSPPSCSAPTSAAAPPRPSACARAALTLPDSAPIMRRVMASSLIRPVRSCRAGVSRDRICIDPGAGFGKSVNEDIVIQRETAKMVTLGYPLMCAVSRKRVVGAVSGVENRPTATPRPLACASVPSRTGPTSCACMTWPGLRSSSTATGLWRIHSRAARLWRSAPTWGRRLRQHPRRARPHR